MMERPIIDAVAAELASLLGAILDAPGRVTAAEAPITPRWVVVLSFDGPATGSVRLGFDAEGGAELARLISGLDQAPPDAVVADSLKETCSQTISAMSQHGELAGLRLIEARVESAPATGPGVAVNCMLTIGTRISVPVALWATANAVTTAPHASGMRAVDQPANLDVILDIELPLSVRFGEAEVTLHRLTKLAPGSLIDLGRSPDDPVEVLVNGRLVARGEVVVVSGNYGVRITEVISASDRLRTVAA